MIDLEADLALVDGLSPVVLTDAAGAVSDITVDTALHRPKVRREAEDTYGEYVRTMASWHVRASELGGYVPKPADRLTEADGTAWVVVENENLYLIGKHRLLCARVALLVNETAALLQRTDDLNELNEKEYKYQSQAVLTCRFVLQANADKTLSGERKSLHNAGHVLYVPPVGGVTLYVNSLLQRNDGTYWKVKGYDHANSLQWLQRINVEREYNEPQ